jgi:hypothetical protein
VFYGKKISMKKLLLTYGFLLVLLAGQTQEVMRVKDGATVTIQNGVEVNLQGGITLEQGGLLSHNGTLRLKNNSLANQSDWTDLSSVGAMNGNGLVIFNSSGTHNFLGPTGFYAVQINTGGLYLANDLSVSNLLQLVSGRVHTGNNRVWLVNNTVSSLWNDPTNTGYINSWINGNFSRAIATNTGTYDFPVGNLNRCNLLQLFNNNLTGTQLLTSSFGPKPGTDVGLNVIEQGMPYSAVNNGGIWYLEPDAAPTGGNYALQLYFNGFTGLSDNQFGILRRPAASSDAADWMVPAGSALEPLSGAGRKLSDGYARRINISDFSQWGIGMFDAVPCYNCTAACTYSQGYYGNPKGTSCYVNFNGTAESTSSTQLMLNAFGNTTSVVFGNTTNLRFFTLFRTDISSGKIFKMLPGSGNSQVLGIDNVAPYDGAYYDDPSTWSLVPIQPVGSKKGSINNLLLAQLMTLWFNLRNSTTLGTIDLSRDTLVTVQQTSCGSGIPTGDPSKYGLPHNIVLYLNGGNGYTHDINGLFSLGNDILGGANTGVTPEEIQKAIATINLAFEGCRILSGYISYVSPVITKALQYQELNEQTQLMVTAFPNPSEGKFTLRITTPVSGMATIAFYSANGARVHEMKQYVSHASVNLVPYTGPYYTGALLYRVSIGRHRAAGMVIGPD